MIHARDRSRSPKGATASSAAGNEEIPVGDKTDYEKVLRELPEPTTPLEVLQSCSSLAVGLTSLVASLKTTNERSLATLQDQQRSRLELARALETVAAAISRQANGIESLVAGVNYNTGRLGAVSGEMQKLRKWIEWVSPRPLAEYHKQSSELTKEEGAAEPCGMGPGEPCGMGIGEPCGMGVIPSGPAVGFPPLWQVAQMWGRSHVLCPVLLLHLVP